MKVFISLPMSGRTDAEITALKEQLFEEYKAENPRAVLMDAYSDVKNHMGEFYTYEHPPIAMLAESLMCLADSDLIIMAPRWERHRGCQIEHQVAKEYGIPIKYAR